MTNPTTLADAYLASPDWIKALMVIAPCLTLIALVLGLCALIRPSRRPLPGALPAYTILQSESGYHVFRHLGAPGEALPAPAQPPVPEPPGAKEIQTLEQLLGRSPRHGPETIED